jgi:chromosomal replication initiator protein
MALLNFARFTPTSGSIEALELATALSSGQGTTRLLLMCGPPGVGKTHLLHAMLDRVRARLPSARVVHASAVELVQDLIAALQCQGTPSLPREYAHADALAVDDLHVMAGKPRTQQEVGRLFKAALDSGTRVACAAGCRLEDLPVLADALHALPTARLVDLRRPSDSEMRRILTAMAEAKGTPLSAQTVAAIASQCGGDVRRAIGGLVRRRFEEGRRLDATDH